MWGVSSRGDGGRERGQMKAIIPPGTGYMQMQIFIG